MNAVIRKSQTDLARRVAVVAAVLAVAVLNADALGSDTAQTSRYLWASIAAAVPVLLVFVLLAELRPRTALLGLVGLLTGGVALALTSAGFLGVAPLAVAFGCVLALGLGILLARRARLAEVIEGVLVAYVGLAFILEISIPLHNL